MAQGWEELRLITDGRWQPTGQLHDAFPWAEPAPTRFSVVPKQTYKYTFHAIDAPDTFGVERHIFVGGPGGKAEPVGALGWARFVRAS